jgi:hypothetical protein
MGSGFTEKNQPARLVLKIMDEVLNSELTVFTGTEEQFLLSTIFLLKPFCAAFCICMLFSLVHNYDPESSMEKKSAMISAILCIVCSMARYICFIFLATNFYVKWDFSALNYHYSNFPELVLNVGWLFGKVFFYSGFTFNVIHKLEQQQRKIERLEVEVQRLKQCLKRIKALCNSVRISL